MTEKRFVNKGKDIFQYGEWWCSTGGEHCADVITTTINELIEENEQLKSENQSWLKTVSHVDNVAHKDRDYAKRMHKENEQLKQSYIQLKHRHSLLHDVCLDAECDRDGYHNDVLSLEKENGKLKSEIKDLNDILARYEEKELKE